jgi:hypothetical protein
MRSSSTFSDTSAATEILEEAPALSKVIEQQPPDLSDQGSIRLKKAGGATTALVCAGLTAIAVAVHGYHPFAEDGGIYLTAIKKILHPDLYPRYADFAAQFARFSFFERIVAGLARVPAADLMTILFVMYVISIWMTLLASWKIAKHCFSNRTACYAAVSLIALCLTLPIAGTSLLLMDPYVTSRSISTPCTLLALGYLLDAIQSFQRRYAGAWKSLAMCAISLAVAAVVHPLMAAYALGCVVLLASASIAHLRWRVVATASVCLVAISAAFLLYKLSPHSTADYAQVAQTRTYWFLDNWQWYELVGMLAPLALIGAIFLPSRSAQRPRTRALAQMAITVGFSAALVAILFARISSSSYAVARLQPLRVFQLIYVVMILAIGGFLGERVFKRSLWRWSVMLVSVGAIFLFVQRQTFPHSAHIEFPWSAPANGWEQGFEWIRDHTPRDAVFALDANYITAAGEDSQNFSAIAERSALPDYAKDGGIAAIAPSLTREWIDGEKAQKNLNTESDNERALQLRSSPAEWIVLSRNAETAFPCFYSNGVMKVCRVPQ